MYNILITGGAGFVGTNLIKKLLSKGHSVTSFDNYITGKKENHQQKCKYININLANDYREIEKALFTINKYNVIFHLAAFARIQPSFIDPQIHIYNNFISTLNILEYARKNKIKLIYSGSSSVHKGIYNSPYSWTKWSGEELCLLYQKVYNMDISICRFYNVYGDYQIEEGDYATIIGIFEKQYREGNPFTIVGNGEQRRDFTHINDIVQGLIKCIYKKSNGDIYELGRGVNYSINEVANMFNDKHPKKYLPERKGEYDTTLADYSKAENELNYKPIYNLIDYINSKVNGTT